MCNLQDSIGIRTINVEKALKVYASTLNKNVSDLTEAEKQQAVVNAVLDTTKAEEYTYDT